MDLLKADLIRNLGYSGPMDQIEQLLEVEGLSSRRKRRIQSTKRHEVGRLLRSRLLAACLKPGCQASAREILAGVPERILAEPATPGDCEICHGSRVHPSVEGMIAACQRAGWKRLCIVGGSPASREVLQSEVGGRLELRLVDGTARRAGKQARCDLAWADHCTVWGATELAHRVSLLYTDAAHCSSTSRRGIQDLAKHITDQANLYATKRREAAH